jgi:hypothetical protein
MRPRFARSSLIDGHASGVLSNSPTRASIPACPTIPRIITQYRGVELPTPKTNDANVEGFASLGSQKKIKSGQAATKGVVESSSWHGINGFTIRLNCRDDASRCTSGNGLMKFAVDRPYSDPEKAARKLIEIANSVDAVQDGRIYIEKINGPFLFEFKGSPDEYRAALKLAIDRSWLWLDRSGTYVKFTQAGAELFA